MAALPKRLLVGTPLHSARMGETLLPKKLALPVFCSDPLSSNAYATEEILLMLSLGGLALLHITPWVAARRGAAARHRGPLLPADLPRLPRRRWRVCRQPGQPGRTAALVAASALLVDYVLTVAVSVCAGVANIVSAVPQLAPHVVLLSVRARHRPGPDEPARHQGVGHRVRRPHLRLRRLRHGDDRARPAQDARTATRPSPSPPPSASRPSRPPAASWSSPSCCAPSPPGAPP